MSAPLRIEVWADWAGLKSRALVGHLAASATRGKTVFAFRYDESWLRSAQALQLDPRLGLFGGDQYPPGSRENFGVFLDSSPDRWGRVLLERREAARARAEERAPRALRPQDYLLGVYDPHRLGGLRFRLGPELPFLDDDAEFAAPPWASLRELEGISRKLEEEGAEDQPEYGRWLRMLVAPGRSLGGARPKASVVADDGSLWIAKFPSAQDRSDVGAWEGVAHRLAAAAKVEVAPARTQRFGGPHHTFLTQRFDRLEGGARVHFVSAMTELERSDGEEGASYLDLAEVLIQKGAQPSTDLEQLWRRIVFNVCISNVDDHLRNHGFLLGPTGWRLAPAYDLNPAAHGDGLSLNISEVDNAQSLELVLEVAEYFRVKRTRAQAILKEVQQAVGSWKAEAKAAGISATEQATMAPAFRLASG